MWASRGAGGRADQKAPGGARRPPRRAAGDDNVGGGWRGAQASAAGGVTQSDAVSESSAHSDGGPCEKRKLGHRETPGTGRAETVCGAETVPPASRGALDTSPAPAQPPGPVSGETPAV